MERVVMHKRLLLMSVLVAISTICAETANSADITSWDDLKANKDAESIIFQSDVNATGDEFPMPIDFSLSTPQTLDGNYHSFSSDPYTGAGYYSLSINNTGSLTLKNFGKYVEGTAGSNTFSYTDLNDETKYIDIQKSVNSFSGYFLTLKKPITVNIQNSVFANNGKDTDARLISGGLTTSAGGTINVADCIFYNNTMANAGPVVNGDRFNVNIDNTIFYGNQNVKVPDGGAVKSDGTIIIKNSYFVNNTAATATGTSGRGGAVYFNKGSGHTIENTKFEGNTAGSQGGAVYLYYNATADYIKDSEFIGNTATGSSGGGVALGGGYLRTIDNVLFDGNTSGNKGGGLYVEELVDAPAVTKVTLVKDTIFQNNTAKSGGGMYFSSDFGINDKFAARIVDTDFTSNSATQGGGLYIINGDVGLIADNKDVTFSGNTASDVGDDVYFKTNTYAATLFLNAADEKKITFNGTIAAAKNKSTSPTPTIDINKTGVTYSTYEGDTETVHNAGTTGEIQFNNTVGDTNNNFDINLYGGTLSVGANSSATNPDGLLNDNNFYVKGDSTLNTINGVIGEFAPKVFSISNGYTLDYQMDVDLVNAVSDTINVSTSGGSIQNDGILRLSAFNISSDSDVQDLKIKYSNTNVNGVLKDDYTIMTSTETYNVSVENIDSGDEKGSYVIFSQVQPLGGLAAAIHNQADQYVITDGQDENVTEWAADEGNIIKHDIDINGNGNSIYTENDLDGMVVSEGKSAVLRNIEELSGFKNALTNNGGSLTITDTNVTGNTGDADITNNGGTVNINANTKDVTIGSDDTGSAIVSKGGTVSINGADDNEVTINGDLVASDSAIINVNTDTTFNGEVSVSDDTTTLNVNADATIDTLTNAGKVNNSGNITVRGGENNGTIVGDNGKMNIDGGFINNSEISQKEVAVTDNATADKPFNNNGDVISDTFINNGYTVNGANGTISADTITNEGALVSDASNITSTNGKPVTNNGDIDFTAGTNNNDIVGEGTTTVSGDVENVANINNDVVVNADASLNNNGGLLGGEGKTVTNDGTLTSDGNIIGSTVNNGTLTNSGDVEGNVVNNNTLNNNLSISGDVTNSENGKITNASGASVVGGLNNKGVIDNAGAIIASNSKSINNSGTINNTGDLNGKINNATSGIINTTIEGMDGEITNHGNIHYTNGGEIVNDIEGDGVVHLDGKGTAVLNSDLDKNTLSLNNGTLIFGANKDISRGGFIGNGGSIGKVLDGKTSTYKLGNANLVKDTKVDGIDFDLSKLTSDKFIANFSGKGKLDIDKVQIKGITLKDKIRVFLGDTTKVDKQHLRVKDQKLPAIMTPIRRMTGKVENNYLTYSGSGNGAKDFNPAIMASPVATLIGGQITQSQTLQDSFFHMNRYMKYSSGARIAAQDRNKYAQTGLDTPPSYIRSSIPETSQAMWIKPYTTFEKVSLKGGLGVSNVAYGALYGGDTDLYDLGNGYKGIVSAFVGYNGSHQAYNGISMNQQGGTLGVTGTLYHGNFFTGLTVSAGASAGNAYTPFGTDHFALMSAGVANKTGYNFEFANGKFIVQPSLYMGYTFVNTFDYKNAAGINIDSDPLNTIQIAPGIKFIGNLENGWQPYAGIDMMWNIMGRTHFRAADTRLPELSVKPYVQYGVGVQKSWGERFTAFFQTMIRNGGRTGIVLEGGFRWTLGKDPKNVSELPKKDKTVIKRNPNEIRTQVKGDTMTITTSKKGGFMSKMDGSGDVVKFEAGERKVIKQYYDISKNKNNRIKIVATSGI